MSKIFYDHLVVLEQVEVTLSSSDFTSSEKEKIHHLIEESVHYRVMTKILDHLPAEHHEEFLKRFHEAPYSEDLLSFLKEKIANIEELIVQEIKDLEKLLLEDIKSSRLPSKASK